MAIVYQSGSIYATSTGQLITGRAKVAYILFNAQANNDNFELQDGLNNTSPIKLHIHSDNGLGPTVIDISKSPLVFNSGIYLSILPTNCHLTLILTNEGAS